MLKKHMDVIRNTNKYIFMHKRIGEKMKGRTIFQRYDEHKCVSQLNYKRISIMNKKGARKCDKAKG